MSARREPIMARFLVLASEVTGFTTKKRNVKLADNDKLDAVILLDGDETNVSPAARPGQAGLMRPQIMRMSPELFILIREKRPTNEEVGTRLNAYQAALIKKIAQDAEMAGLVGSNGSVVYKGCATDLKSGSTLSGTMRLDFEFTYPLIPSEL